MKRGRFITLEGGEGAGKTTQAALLAEFLVGKGYEVVVTREPGGAAGAEEIRRILVTGAAERWSAIGEMLLLFAARDDHLNTTIRPALQRGAWVVCDRFSDSTRAYQGIVGGVDIALIETIEQAVVANTMPDLTIVFDIDPQEGLNRAGGRAAEGPAEDRFERKGQDFHMRLREAFLAIARAEPERCVIVDAEREVGTVAEEVRTIVERRLAGAITGE